jgi:hypothetical protein
MDDNQEQILFNLEIQLEDEQTANIIIRENDDIDELVDKFCEEHQFEDNIKQAIMNQISETIDKNIEECILFN